MGQGGSRKVIQGVFETIKGEMIAQTIVVAVKFWMNFESDSQWALLVVWMWCVAETVESRI